jgi:hypothetical protein
MVAHPGLGVVLLADTTSLLCSRVQAQSGVDADGGAALEDVVVVYAHGGGVSAARLLGGAVCVLNENMVREGNILISK